MNPFATFGIIFLITAILGTIIVIWARKESQKLNILKETRHFK